MSTHIAFDIEREIIKRLPVKSLVRFRPVCKSWKAFIDSPEFITDYRAPQNQPQHLLMKYEVGDRQETEFKCVSFVDDDNFPQQKFTPIAPSLLEELYLPRIINSSHGVLCIYGFYHRKEGSNCPPDSVTDIALLWNPSIRKSTAVAVPHEVSGGQFSSVLGFGVCPDTCDPMLVYVTFVDHWSDSKGINSIPWQVLVFTLSLGVWYLCDNLPRKSVGFTWSSTAIGQFIYWFAYDMMDENGELGYRNLVMSFDMLNEEFTEIDLPDSLAHLPEDLEDMPEYAFSVSKLRESLVVLEYTESTTTHQVCVVWMMDHGDPKSFMKLFTIQAPDAKIKRTLGFSRSGEAIIELEEYISGFRSYMDATLAVYEPCTNHINDFVIYARKNSVNSYTESLLLLNEEDDCIYCI